MENPNQSDLDELGRCYKAIAELNERIKRLQFYLTQETLLRENAERTLKRVKRRNRRLEKILGIYTKYKE